MAQIRYAGEVFEGYDKPKRTPGDSKKFAVLVRDDGEPKIVRFGDPSMEHYREGRGSERGHGDEERRENFKSRHNCDEKTDKTTPGFWSCHWSWMYLVLVYGAQILNATTGIC
jgi:hypothetical protein